VFVVSNDDVFTSDIFTRLYAAHAPAISQDFY